MKKIIFICVLLTSIGALHAQIEKGQFQVGVGGMPIVYPGLGGIRGYSLRGNFGYSPFSNFVFGLQPFTGKVDDITSTGLGLYARQYLTKDRFAPFIEAGFGLGKLKYEESPQVNGTLSAIHAGVGARYLVSDRVAIELAVQYSQLKNITHPETTVNGNVIIPTIGIQYTFGGNK